MNLDDFGDPHKKVLNSVILLEGTRQLPEADRPLLEPMKCAACGHQESKIQDNGEKLELGEGPQAKQYGKLRKCPKCGKFSFGFIEEDPDYGKYLAPKLHAPHPKRK